MSARHTARGGAKAVWFAAVLVLLAGCVFVVRADQARIAERVADDRRILDRLVVAERTMRGRGALERERRRLQRTLRTVDLAGDRTAVAARFVRDAAAIAARHHTLVAAIAAVAPLASAAPVPAAASAAVTTASAPAPTPPADAFETIPLDVTVEGRYADVLATIAALSAARVPTTVDVASLARKQAGSADATLSAQLHVAIQRLAPTLPTRAATRPA